MLPMSLAVISPVGVHLSDWMDSLLEGVNEAVSLDDFWKALVNLLDHTFPIQSCSMMYSIQDPNTLVARHHVGLGYPGLQVASNLAIASNFLAKHPQIKMYTFSQILTEDPGAQVRASEQQQASPEGWTEFVHLAFWNGASLDAVFSIRRGPNQERFTPAELTLLLRLHPVINAGLRRIRALGVQQEQRAVLERFFRRCPIPVIFLDSGLRLLYATQEALEVCSLWNHGAAMARRQHPRKSFQVPDDIAEVCRNLLAQPAPRPEDKAADEVRVVHPSAENLVARVRIDRPTRRGWMQPTLLVNFCAEQNLDGARLPAGKMSFELLQRLSANERRVALLVCEGHSNAVIAQKLGKSARTVECQLTVIFRKFQVANRVQLTRALT